MLAAMIVDTLISIPISYYSNFVIEEKWGYNKQTIGLFFKDLIKGFVLGVVFATILIAVLLSIIQYCGDNLIFYLSLVTIGFVLLL